MVLKHMVWYILQANNAAGKSTTYMAYYKNILYQLVTCNTYILYPLNQTLLSISSRSRTVVTPRLVLNEINAAL